jgi:hypothetical protein
MARELKKTCLILHYFSNLFTFHASHEKHSFFQIIFYFARVARVFGELPKLPQSQLVVWTGTLSSPTLGAFLSSAMPLMQGWITPYTGLLLGPYHPQNLKTIFHLIQKSKLFHAKSYLSEPLIFESQIWNRTRMIRKTDANNVPIQNIDSNCTFQTLT